jgi:hypothetical protein
MMMQARAIKKTAARIRGLDVIGCVITLGFRAVALHPRLYSVARIRGLGFDTRNSRTSLGKDKFFKAGLRSAQTLVAAAAVEFADQTQPSLRRLNQICNRSPGFEKPG